MRKDSISGKKNNYEEEMISANSEGEEKEDIPDGAVFKEYADRQCWNPAKMNKNAKSDVHRKYLPSPSVHIYLPSS